MWKGMELKSGQIGLLTVLQNTPLYQLNGDKKIMARTLKPKEVYRIYSFLPGKLGVGGGYFIDRDSRIKYESPSKTSLNAVQCIHKIDLSTSIYSTVKQIGTKGELLWYNIVYDKNSENFSLYPVQYSGYIAGNAIYTLDNDPSSTDRNYNNNALYRLDLTNPAMKKKIIGNISNAQTDGQYIYYSINGEGWSRKIYKSALAGNEPPQLIKEIDGFYNLDFYFANGYIYLHNNTSHQIERFSTNGGDIEIVNNFISTFGESFSKIIDSHYAIASSNSQNYFSFYQIINNQINFDKVLDQIIYDPQTNKLFKFTGPACAETIKVYKNILYYPKHYSRDELFSVDSQGNVKSVLKVNGAIIGFSDNYVVYFDEKKGTVNKVKFAN